MKAVLLNAAIKFPKLGFQVEDLQKSIKVFGLQISFYGIIMACAFLLAIVLIGYVAKRTKQNQELYLDFAIRAIVAGIIGARIGYVLVRWSEFKEHPAQIFSLRNGGLSFYGAVLAVLIVAYMFSRRRKYSFWELCDTIIPGVLLGQIVGRLGDFFNRDMLGRFSDGLFSMQVAVKDVNPALLQLSQTTLVENNSYIQTHPVFLYEMVWNLLLLIFFLIYFRFRKYKGEITGFYMIGYGTIRFLLEQIRLDALYIQDSSISIGMLISIIMILSGLIFTGYQIFILPKRKKS